MRRNVSGAEFAGLVALVFLVGAAIMLLNTWIFEILWNNFVVTHVSGVTTVSFWGAFVPALLATSLFGRSYYRQKS